MNKDDEFEGFYCETDCFKLDKNWNPRITEEELIEYSRKEYWDLED